jgi:hypothetical protein
MCVPTCAVEPKYFAFAHKLVNDMKAQNRNFVRIVLHFFKPFNLQLLVLQFGTLNDSIFWPTFYAH